MSDEKFDTMVMKNKLIDYVRKQYRETWLKTQGDPSRIVSLLDKINPNLCCWKVSDAVSYLQAFYTIHRPRSSVQDRE